MSVVAAAIVDSRNMFHQAGEAIGVRRCPTVPGVRGALGRYGLQVAAVHVGLALARPSDVQVLARQHADNDAYRQQVLADGGDVLQGELHRKPSGSVEEKMVDSACCVRITRYVDEIVYKRTNVQTIVVLSKDIDLQPAVEYAASMNVPIVVAALDVVQHRPYPYLLLGPSAFAEMTQSPLGPTGHEMRDLCAQALQDGKPLQWVVRGLASDPVLVHGSGLRGKPVPGTSLPRAGQSVSLYPVDLDWVRGSAPLLICSATKPQGGVWDSVTVRRRRAPMNIEVTLDGGGRARAHYPLGGVAPGDRVLIHQASGRAIGRDPAAGQTRSFDPDTPVVVRVVSSLPNGGALAADASRRRGILNTSQKLSPGQRVPAVQVDVNRRGPVWAAIGTPLA